VVTPTPPTPLDSPSRALSGKAEELLCDLSCVLTHFHFLFGRYK
jgi:hypothetical protein